MKAEQLTLFFISPDNTVVEAMQKIDRNARGILFVVNEQQKLLGVITDGDIRRWLIRTGELKAAVGNLWFRKDRGYRSADRMGRRW